MSTDAYEEFEADSEDFDAGEPIVIEVSPSTKLERRRKIEDLFEEKRLRAELEDFA